MQLKSKYDVIVIGAGIGGLISGCYLAKSGLSVLIIEKNDRVGGCCVYFERKGFKFDAGAHILGSCSKGQSLGDILNELGINIDFIRFRPTDRIHFPDRDIEVSDDIQDFIAMLKDEFPLEANGIDGFFELMDTAQNNLKAAFLFKKYSEITYKDLLNTYFKSAKLINILSFGCGYLGLPPETLSGLSALFLMKSYLYDGSYYPRGGSQVFSNAIADKFIEYGGSLALNSRATKIACSNGAAEGVYIDDVLMKSDAVVSNIDCKETYNNLIGSDIIKNDSMVSRKIQDFRNSISFFVLYLGMDDGYDLKNKNGWYFNTDDISCSFNSQIYLHIPTLIDKSIAPDGKQLIEMGTTFPIKFNEVLDWKNLKKDQISKKTELLNTILPGVKDHIEYCDAATPMTIYRYTSNSMGALYGWEQCPSQVFMNAFPPTSKAVSNLYLAGHWTFPGGGIVSVAISGMLAAKKIIKKINNQASRHPLKGVV